MLLMILTHKYMVETRNYIQKTSGVIRLLRSGRGFQYSKSTFFLKHIFSRCMSFLELLWVSVHMCATHTEYLALYKTWNGLEWRKFSDYRMSHLKRGTSITRIILIHDSYLITKMVHFLYENNLYHNSATHLFHSTLFHSMFLHKVVIIVMIV